MRRLVRAGNSSRFPVRHSLLVRCSPGLSPSTAAGVRLFRFEGVVVPLSRAARRRNTSVLFRLQSSVDAAPLFERAAGPRAGIVRVAS